MNTCRPKHGYILHETNLIFVGSTSSISTPTAFSTTQFTTATLGAEASSVTSQLLQPIIPSSQQPSPAFAMMRSMSSIRLRTVAMVPSARSLDMRIAGHRIVAISAIEFSPALALPLCTLSWASTSLPRPTNRLWYSSNRLTWGWRGCRRRVIPSLHLDLW